MKNKIFQFTDAVYLACIWLSGISIFIMSLLIPYSIFARFVLGTGSSWPEPITVMLMVVFTFLGASAGYRARSHIAVSMVTERLPAPLQRGLARLIDLLMLIVALFMLIYGSKLCMETWDQNIGQLEWLPVGLTYLPVPLGGLTTLIFVLEHVLLGPQHQRAVVTYDHEKHTPEAA